MCQHMNNEVMEIDTLIIVCCHAIYHGVQNDPYNEEAWLIESFQTGETPTYIQHIEAGIRQLVANTPRALLTFSGGATKRARIQALKAQNPQYGSLRESLTEAEGYHHVAIAEKFFGLGEEHESGNRGEEGSGGVTKSKLIRSRVYEEKFATDSYQNILLALLQYPIWVRQSTTQFSNAGGPNTQASKTVSELILPKKLVIVSHDFKRARFMDLHLPAIKYLFALSSLSSPDFGVADAEAMMVEYVGIDPPFDPVKMAEIAEGDRVRGYGPWKVDLHGIGELLSGKRAARGWVEDDFINDLGRWYDFDTLEKVKKLLRGGS